MYSRRISALLALPLMAIAIALIGGIPGTTILKDVINAGSMKLHNAYTTTMIGAILAELVNKHGIAKQMVRFVAEFSGDNPFLLGLLMTLVTALLFSSLGGLGAVIMVGTVVLPVMLSLGIPAITAGGLYLFGISIGGMFNLANWTLYIDILHVAQNQIVAYVVPFAASLTLILIAFLTFELKKLSNLKYALLSSFILIASVFAYWQYAQSLPQSKAAAEPNQLSLLLAAACFIVLACYAVFRQKRRLVDLPAAAFLTPVIPLLLVLCCGWDIISAFFAGISFCTLITWRIDSINILTRSIIEGAQSVMPAVLLMIGIGMLLNAVMDPHVAASIAPLLQAIIPTKAIPFIFAFTLMAPLALYRGPLSLWGMGSGIVVLIQKSTSLGGQAVMSMLMSVGQLQGICDPTNTHNVWIATYLGTDTQALLRKTIPYAWSAVIAGLVLAVMFGYVSW
ncbi:MAG: hypothetical protein K2W82_18660 [Candidatus Obscuribacterales bacterium]|nr:hypothetical protein [Candidatus Obscuribacterales bacterium]